MSEEKPVPPDDPRMIAWKAYEVTQEYKNTLRWAQHAIHPHVEGSLWAAFLEGFEAGRKQGAKEARP